MKKSMFLEIDDSRTCLSKRIIVLDKFSQKETTYKWVLMQVCLEEDDGRTLLGK